jgi:endonuclease/exonuclease/phosphatase family metal-dependent hydrolase
MKIVRKLLHSVLLTSNFGLVLALLVCGNVHLIKPLHSSLYSFLAYAYMPLLLANVFFLVYWGIRLKPWALVSLAGLILTWSSARAWFPLNISKKEPAVKTLSILTFNVEYFSHSNVKLEHGIHPILIYIKEKDPDVVFLQEAGPQFVNDLRTKQEVENLMKSYPFFASGEQENRYSVVLLSKFRILKFGRIEYQSQSNSSFWYDVKIGKDTVRFINNHLESNKLNPKEKVQYSDMIRNHESGRISEVAEVLGSKVGNATVIRAVEADSVASLIKRTPYREIVVCGDFNDVPGSYIYRKIRSGLKDAWVERGNGWGHTFHDHFFLFRIDYILYSPTIRCLEIEREKVNFSDHYPLWAKLVMP